MEGPARGSGALRKLNAAINLGNLVIPSGTGPGWARPSASCQGEPGIVKDVLPLRECGRGTDGGTVVEGPARGSRDHRELTAAINLGNLVIPSGTGPGWARPGGHSSTKAVGFMPRRTRHRERRAAAAGMWTRH